MCCEWTSDFEEAVCKPPFINFLQKYHKSNLDFRSAIRLGIGRIKLMKIPKSVSGFNTSNGKIIIKIYNGDLAKSATFYVFLHEIAHFLQRIENTTLGDNARNFSFENLRPELTDGEFEIEGGDYLEEKLFGGKKKLITYDAAMYLISKNLPNNQEEFTQKFEELSKENSDSSKISIKLKSGESVFLGHCGFRTIPIQNLKKLK